MKNDVLANLGQGGTNALEVESEKEAKETPPASPAEEKTETESPSQTGEMNTSDESKLPFHKHPRWNAMRKENEDLRTKLDEISQWKQSTETRLSSLPQSGTEERLPDWFLESFGENQAAYKAWKNMEKGVRDGIREELRREMEQEKVSQATEEKKYLDWVDESVSALEDEQGIDLHSRQGQNLRNEILKVAVDFQPTSIDANGVTYIDLKKAYEIHKRLNGSESETVKAKKALSSSTMSGSSSEAPRKDYLTSNDIRKMSWSNLSS